MSNSIDPKLRCHTWCYALLTLLLFSTGSAFAGDGQLNADGTLDLEVNFRFPPTEQNVERVVKAVRRANFILCDATEGQVRFGTVRLTSGTVNEDRADVWISPIGGRSSGGASVVNGVVVPGLGKSGRQIILYDSAWFGALLAHELGHYVFALGEQYDEQGRQCRLSGENCGIGLGFEKNGPFALSTVNNSIMQTGKYRCGSRNAVECNFDEDCLPGVPCIEFGTVIRDPDALDGEDNRVRIQTALNAYSEFSVSMNHDQLRGDNVACPTVDGEMCMLDCAERWHVEESRFETTHQSIVNGGESDWETIVRHYPNLEMPQGLPQPDMPGTCDDVTPLHMFDFVDQVALVLDKSGSMGFSVDDDTIEVCKNNVDDDGDDKTDEADCAESRLAFAQAAGRGFVDLVANQGVSLTLVEFDDRAQQSLDFLTVDSDNAHTVKAVIDDLEPGAATAIGDGISVAREAFVAQMGLVDGRSQTALLLSDGQNNAGQPPLEAARVFKDEIEALGGGARIFTIPVGDDADKMLLANLAADSAKMIEARNGAQLPSIFAELAAVYRGDALTLPRTPGVVRPAFIPPGVGSTPDKDLPPISLTFPFNLEEGALALTVFLSGTNNNLETWDLNYLLRNEVGDVFDQNSANAVLDPFYRFIRIQAPAMGEWTLEVFAASGTVVDQEFVVLASVENPLPDCFVDVVPRVTAGEEPVTILARPLYAATLEGEVEIAGTVRRSDGVTVPIALDYAPETGGTAHFDDFVGRGIYEVNLTCTVGPGTLPARGEVIFEGPERPQVKVEPFQRQATTSFFLATADFPPCDEPDCDGDGIDNVVDRCDQDTDGDGIPNCYDRDSDDDEVPDNVEGTDDPDGDGDPNFLDPDSDNDGVPDHSDGKILDCNSNGVVDITDIERGTSQDINSNNIPDECEIGHVVWLLSGTAEGGQILTTIYGFFEICNVVINTVAGQSAQIVAENLTNALNSDSCLSSQDITAVVSGSTVTIRGFALSFRDVVDEITDPGLSHEMPVVTIPALSSLGFLVMAFLFGCVGVFVIFHRSRW